MVPTVIILGLVVGRWWLIPAAAVAWGALILAINDTADPRMFAGAAAIGAANAAAGVMVHRAARLLALEAVKGARAVARR